MRTLLRSVAKALMAVTLVAVVAPANAADDVSGAKARIDGLAKKAISVISDASLSDAQKEAQFATLLRNNFDTTAIGKFALGRYYRQATPEQKAEYNSLFQKMIVKVYNQRFKEYSGQTVAVTGGRKDEKSGDILVNTQINQPGGGQPVPVDWRIRGGKIIDVFVAGVSMSQTQRDDFAGVIQKGGGNIEALLKYLREKCGAA